MHLIILLFVSKFYFLVKIFQRSKIIKIILSLKKLQAHKCNLQRCNGIYCIRLRILYKFFQFLCMRGFAVVSKVNSVHYITRLVSFARGQ